MKKVLILLIGFLFVNIDVQAQELNCVYKNIENGVDLVIKINNDIEVTTTSDKVDISNVNITKHDFNNKCLEKVFINSSNNNDGIKTYEISNNDNVAVREIVVSNTNIEDSAIETNNESTVDHTSKNYEKVEGCDILSNPLKEKIGWAFNIIKYVGTVLAVILGMWDFSNATLSDDAEANAKAFKKFIRRIAAAAIIFLVPSITEFVMQAVNIPGFNNEYCINETE